jgi:hypothetical protein
MQSLNAFGAEDCEGIQKSPLAGDRVLIKVKICSTGLNGVHGISVLKSAALPYIN